MKLIVLILTACMSSAVLCASIPSRQENMEPIHGVGDSENAANTKAIPLPHMLCTGMTINNDNVNVFRTCFPVGCICAHGAGICNMMNKCVKGIFNISFNKEIADEGNPISNPMTEEHVQR